MDVLKNKKLLQILVPILIVLSLVGMAAGLILSNRSQDNRSGAQVTDPYTDPSDSCGGNGFVGCDGETGLSDCGDGKGRVCQITGEWSSCVNADKCGFQGTKPNDTACSFSSACDSLCCVKIDSNGNPLNELASGQAGVCKPKDQYSACDAYGGTPSGTCSYNGRTYQIPSTGSGNFVGCESDLGLGSDPTKNCYVRAGSTDGGACVVECFSETLSCALRGGTTPTPTATATTGPTINPTTNPTSNPTSGPTTNPTSSPTDTPTSGPTTTPSTFACLSIDSNVETPSIGDSVNFTCQADGVVSLVTSYRFRYRVDGGTFQDIGISTSEISQSVDILIDQPGLYEVQCAACSDTECTEWQQL